MPAPSKRDRQNKKRHDNNHPVRTHIRNLSKRFYRAIEAGDIEQASELRDKSQKEFSQAASKGIIPRNRASRKISRLDHALRRVREQS